MTNHHVQMKTEKKNIQHKTIGLLGGIGWASTLEYYLLINEAVVARTGPSHSARIVLISLDQFDFTSRAAHPTSAAIEEFLIEKAQKLKAAGADFFMVSANGAHRFAHAVVPKIDLPFVSIVDETARQVASSKIKKVGLLGVRQTMSGTFYQASLAELGIQTLTPGARDQETIHDIIYAELVQNIVTEQSRQIFIGIIRKLVLDGAQAIILGCTEIPLLIREHDVDVPIFNTMQIHCEAVVEFAFEKGPGASDYTG
jgi:aspartate racemase